jgi:hypothetical protein
MRGMNWMFLFVKYVPMKYGMMGEFGSNLYLIRHYGQIMICKSMIIDDELLMIPKLINARTHLWLNYLIIRLFSKIQSSGIKKTKSTIREYWLIWPGLFWWRMDRSTWLPRGSWWSVQWISRKNAQKTACVYCGSIYQRWKSLTFLSQASRDQSPCDSALFESRRCPPSRQWYWHGMVVPFDDAGCSQILQERHS